MRKTKRPAIFLWSKIAFLTTQLVIVLSTVSQAQSLKEANQNFERFAFVKAISAYESLLNNSKYNEKEHEVILRNLARAYKAIQDTQNAEKTFKKLIRFFDIDDPAIYLDYAQVLACNKKYEESRKNYEHYASLQTTDLRGKTFMEAYKNMGQFYKDSSLFITEPAFFNSTFSDFSPMYYKNGIVFCSSRNNTTHKKSEWDQTSFLDLYYVSLNDEKRVENYIWNKKESNNDYSLNLFSHNLTTKYNEGPITFSKNQNQIILTRNSKNKSKLYRLKVFNAQFDAKENDWTDVEELPFNSDNYSCGHPAFTPNNKRLYFVSDMPGGEGGTDIYFIDFKNQQWGSPVNAGKNINTAGDEKFPYVNSKGVLYFSSNGLPGIGGLDIFRVDVGKDGFPLSVAENLGVPFNSEKDDFGFICDESGEAGYFSSNRKRGFYDDDIYAFKKTCHEFKVFVYDSKTDMPMDDVEVLVTKNGKVQNSLITQSNYAVICVDNIANYQFSINKEGSRIKSISVADGKNNQCLNIYLEKSPLRKNNENVNYYTANMSNVSEIKGHTETKNTNSVNKRGDYEKKNDAENPTRIAKKPQLSKAILEYIELCNVFFDFGESHIRSDQTKILDRLADILKKNPALIIQVCSHTDSRASKDFNQKLSEERADSIVKYLVSEGVSSTQLIPMGVGEDEPFVKCEENSPEELHQKNRRTDFKIVSRY